jgi:elongation factor 1-gamma
LARFLHLKVQTAFPCLKHRLFFSTVLTCNVVAAAKPNSPLLGKNKKEAAAIYQWIAFSDTELYPWVSKWLYPLLGYWKPDVEVTENAKESAKKSLEILNKVLLTRTYLVGETITLADINVASFLFDLYQLTFEPSFIAPYGNVTRWFTTIVNQPHFKAAYGEFKPCQTMQVAKEVSKPVEEAKKNCGGSAECKCVGSECKCVNCKCKGCKNKKPAKDEKPKEAKKEKQPSNTPKKAKEEKEEPEDDLEIVEKPKEKNPLDLLPKSPFVLDEWKRFYSNNDTRPTAVDWFWKNFDSEGYSIWKCDYKYSNELTQIFMSSNLIGGFFQRLDRARKYAFGSILVLGTDGKNEISGYFVFRGHQVPFEVTDAADYESYKFTRVNEKDAKVREDFNAYIAWDEKINGKPCADGKVFK